jgi:flagellar motor switch protein FliN/FliY
VRGPYTGAYGFPAVYADNYHIKASVKADKDVPMPVLRSQPQADTGAPTPSELERILSLEVPLIVKLAELNTTLQEIMRLGPGAILEFPKPSDEPLELMINNKTVAIGEAVKVGENFGLKITQIGDVKQLIQSMGKA